MCAVETLSVTRAYCLAQLIQTNAYRCDKYDAFRQIFNRSNQLVKDLGAYIKYVFTEWFYYRRQPYITSQTCVFVFYYNVLLFSCFVKIFLTK